MRTLEADLSESSWWPVLDGPQRARVLREVCVQEVGANQLVCHKGAQVAAWLGVLDGLVKLSSDSAEGRSVTLAGIPAGGWFGEGSLLKSEPRRYDVVALRDSRVAALPRPTFHWLLDTSLGFSRFLVLQLNERLAQFIAALEYQRLLSPEARVARCVAQLFNPLLYPSRTPSLRISQAELGLLTGLSRQRVNRALQQLEALLLIKIAYGGVTVLSLDGLLQFESDLPQAG